MSSAPSGPDGRDDGHHRRVMIIAIIAVALLLGAMVWVTKLIISQQKLERCLASGRRDCLQINVPPRSGFSDNDKSTGGS
jgi:hypothetical protein